MDLEQARQALGDATERIGELERQLTTLTEERDTATGRATELETARVTLDSRLSEATGAHEALTASLTQSETALSAARSLGLGHLRRALLAELSGQVVPELVAGDDEPTLLASVEVAKQAHGRAVEEARTMLARQTVPSGAPSARTVSAAGLSPLEMIESGLRK